MLTINYKPFIMEEVFKEDFLSRTKKLLTEIECRVHDMLSIVNVTFIQHEKDMRNIVSGGKCLDGVSSLVISDDPTGRLGINLTDQHRWNLLSKGPHRSMLNNCPVKPSMAACKQDCFAKPWYDINPFIEYSQNNKVFCFARSLFGSEIGCSGDMWQSEGGIKLN